MRLRRLEPVLRRALRGPCRLPHGSTLLVAVSGGADSTALLVALDSLAHEFGLSLHAAHLHHGLRGADADADLAAVRELCARLRIPLTAARWDCAARMRRRGLSGEAGLRALRREWLLSVLRATGAAAIATAHTADDQLETLLMRIARGTGLTGAAGMRARRGAWIKPLLQATRDDVERDLSQHRIAWREDASNASPAFLRNRIRHTVVPALLDALHVPSKEAPARRAGLARRAAALADELAHAERTLARAAARAVTRATRNTAAGPAFDRKALAGLPRVLQTLALRRTWRLAGPQGPDREGLTSRQLEPMLRALATPGTPRRIGMPGGWQASFAKGALSFLHPPGSRQDSRGVARRAGAADARLPNRHAHARSGPASGLSARRRPPRKTPHVRTPAGPATRQERP